MKFTKCAAVSFATITALYAMIGAACLYTGQSLGTVSLITGQWYWIFDLGAFAFIVLLGAALLWSDTN